MIVRALAPIIAGLGLGATLVAGGACLSDDCGGGGCPDFPPQRVDDGDYVLSENYVGNAGLKGTVAIGPDRITVTYEIGDEPVVVTYEVTGTHEER